ncbi:MAG: PTS sugar transporter [Deltaproteobacteria bacterium]|nr:PTS sugar transporter [Deltaproteobacteria bacterium]
MIGILIISHCDVGRELLKAAELILGKLEAADAIAITQTTETQKALNLISEKIKKLDRGHGVLILTDMFGGTPTNLSLSFFKENKVDILTGINLPMLIDIAQNRTNLSLSDLGEKAVATGKKNIAVAGKLLE